MEVGIIILLMLFGSVTVWRIAYNSKSKSKKPHIIEPDEQQRPKKRQGFFEVEVDVSCITIDITFDDGRKFTAKRYGYCENYDIEKYHIRKPIPTDILSYYEPMIPNDPKNPTVWASGKIINIELIKTEPYIIKHKAYKLVDME